MASSIIFGPVNSRRFGKSLGIDLSPAKKQCNFDCLYCELTPRKTEAAQSDTIPLQKVIDALEEALLRFKDIDVITLTANGEPTLYPHLEGLVKHLQTLPQKTLILSNAAAIHRQSIQDTLLRLDMVKLSLDCATQRCFKRLDRPHKSIELPRIIEGIISFKKRFKGKLFIEILMVENINDSEGEIAALDAVLRRVKPDRIDLGSIDRPPAYDVRGLDYETLLQKARLFDPTLPVVITGKKNPPSTPYSYDEAQLLNTLQKRPLTESDTEILFDQETKVRFARLLESGRIIKKEQSGILFFTTPRRG